MRTNYVLIDNDNIQPTSLAQLAPEHFRVLVFLAPDKTKLPRELVISMQALGARAEYVLMPKPGSNSLDFLMAFYVGRLSLSDPEGFFHFISNDTGFDPLILHLKEKSIFAARSPSIEAMPCFKLAAGASAAADGNAKAPAAASSPAPVPAPALAATPAIDELLKLVVDDLNKRKAAKPRKPSTLKSTIHARCGKQTPGATVEAVYGELVRRRFVLVEGDKVSYALPQ